MHENSMKKLCESAKKDAMNILKANNTINKQML